MKLRDRVKLVADQTMASLEYESTRIQDKVQRHRALMPQDVRALERIAHAIAMLSRSPVYRDEVPVAGAPDPVGDLRGGGGGPRAQSPICPPMVKAKAGAPSQSADKLSKDPK